MYTYEYPRPSVAVDLIVVAEMHNTYSKVLMIRRGKEPFKGQLALPGGFLDMNETTLDGAIRELAEETGGKVKYRDVELLGIYDKVDRDPRGRVISVCYEVFVDNKFPVKGMDDATEAVWVDLLPSFLKTYQFAFDHSTILSDLISKHRNLVEMCNHCSRINCDSSQCEPRFGSR